MNNLSPNQLEALRLLGAYTAGRFDIWMLAGSSKASCRAHIMTALEGKKMPQSKSGVNAITAAFYAFAMPEGSCPAIREDNFRDWAISLYPAAKEARNIQLYAGF